MKQVDQITYERTRNAVKVGLAAMIVIAIALPAARIKSMFVRQ